MYFFYLIVVFVLLLKIFKLIVIVNFVDITLKFLKYSKSRVFFSVTKACWNERTRKYILHFVFVNILYLWQFSAVRHRVLVDEILEMHD